MSWLAMVTISVILLFSFSISGRRGMRFWIPATIILGPLALLVWFIMKTERKPVLWHDILIEAIGDLMPTVVAFVAVLILIILLPAAQEPGLLPIILIIALPLIIGWLVFHGPLLASKTGKSYWRFLINRLPQALVAANLGLAGISAIAAPLTMYSIRICTIFPPSIWTFITWWTIVIPGALVGISFLFLYELWAIRGGFQAWSVLAWREAKVNTPSWRDLWWWIILSYVVFLGGFAVSIVLTQLLIA